MPLDVANERFPWELPLIVQAVLSGLAITAGELAAGLVLNVWLGLGVWDYTGQWGNLVALIQRIKSPLSEIFVGTFVYLVASGYIIPISAAPPISGI